MTPLPTRILRQILGLKCLSREEILACYPNLGLPQSPNVSSITLRKMATYRLQEKFYGGLSAPHQAKLNAAIETSPAQNASSPETEKEKSFLPGTRLVRVWKGVQHEVTLRSDGKYEHDGRIFKSLSAIATEITGTRWNGKVFFGLKK